MTTALIEARCNGCKDAYHRVREELAKSIAAWAIGPTETLKAYVQETNRKKCCWILNLVASPVTHTEKSLLKALLVGPLPTIGPDQE